MTIENAMGFGLRVILAGLRSSKNSKSSQDIISTKPDCPTAIIFGMEFYFSTFMMRFIENINQNLKLLNEV